MEPSDSTNRISDVITSTSLFALSDEEIVRLMGDKFSPELERLRRATSIPNKLAIKPTKPSPSRILYGVDYDEVNRTLVGILALRWLHVRDYEAFVGSQNDSVKLSKESFDWLCQFFEEGITSLSDFDFLITSVIINDLGKDPDLAATYRAQTGEDISGLNHDIILLKAAKAGLVTGLDRLRKEDKEDLLRGLELGAECNLGQLAQAENVPASLMRLHDIEKDDRMFKFRFMEQMLDLSGAAGHWDWTCAKTMNEPTFQAYRNVFDAATGIISRQLEVREAYDLILIRRAELMCQIGLDLNVKRPKYRALLRLLCMGRVVDAEAARIYVKSCLAIDKRVRKNLIKLLNLDGEVNTPAVQATYFPALLHTAMNGSCGKTDSEKVRVLQSCLRYLLRVLQIQPHERIDSINGYPIVVVERDLSRVVNDVVASPEFQDNPDILDKQSVPDWQVAKVAKTAKDWRFFLIQ